VVEMYLKSITKAPALSMVGPHLNMVGFEMSLEV
jgi:hypothetical protein